MESHVDTYGCQPPDCGIGQREELCNKEIDVPGVSSHKKKGSARTGGRTLDISLYPTVGSERSIH